MIIENFRKIWVVAVDLGVGGDEVVVAAAAVADDDIVVVADVACAVADAYAAVAFGVAAAAVASAVVAECGVVVAVNAKGSVTGGSWSRCLPTVPWSQSLSTTNRRWEPSSDPQQLTWQMRGR